MGHARKRQVAIMVVAAVVLQFSLVLLAVVLVAPTGRATLPLLGLALAGAALGLGVVLPGVLSLAAAARRRPAAAVAAPIPARIPSPVAAPEPAGEGSTVINPRHRPPTRPAATAPPPAGGWSTVGSPWPRADEDDPHGTLIRPPHR